MLALDHLAIWTEERDGLAARLSDLTGLPVLDGFFPEGRRVARGVRFAGGAFVDLHQVDQSGGQVFLGLRGDVEAVERLAVREGWRVRSGRWREANDGSPWSMLTFRRDHGVLNRVFVIEYGPRPQAWGSPVFDQPLYDAGNAPAAGATLRRVWLSTPDPKASGQALEALGFAPSGEVETAFEPFAGKLYRGAAGDLVLAPGETEAVIRFDLTGPGPPMYGPFGERLVLTIGETP
ncbi:MAG: hypothetical protein Q8Q88_15745 [Phenylobacterium sp.]|uniref:hypothetical protein n=1 Tax=Phenylobacterium sp. TaxID=1871053 RepID=UPI0027331CFE|nr:hypothetical protein [Phenylobacterium sp.]MDP3748492.1 hypothetical protein [Phenylobacterium sp.]